MHPQASKCRHTQNNPTGTFDFSLNVPLSPAMQTVGEYPQTQFFTLKFSLGTKSERQAPGVTKAGR